MRATSVALTVAGTVLAVASGTMANVFDMGPGLTSLEFVTVGDPGNVADGRYFHPPPGSVEYVYRIGKYEVTNAQYAEFLSAVAAVGDRHGLYNSYMGGGGWGDVGGISRTGSGIPGDPWVYSPRVNRGDRPVNWVSFWNACRFANWLHNGQPTGDQDLTTTEDGAYFLNGVTIPDNESIHRKPNARAWIPSDDEWYKAAFYKGGGTDAGYWDYPTQSDEPPTFESPPGSDMLNGSANAGYGVYADSTYYTTEVGAYTGKPSIGPYGTFDQCGNVWEWHERIVGRSHRSIWGGAFGTETRCLKASFWEYTFPTHTSPEIGFRVATIPEPATLALLALGGLAVIRRRRWCW